MAAKAGDVLPAAVADRVWIGMHRVAAARLRRPLQGIRFIHIGI
jgi:hypothetical protein